MVGMLAAGGALDQIGWVHGRMWGEISDASVLETVLNPCPRWARGAGAAWPDMDFEELGTMS
jgi:hypothetical protein